MFKICVVVVVSLLAAACAPTNARESPENSLTPSSDYGAGQRWTDPKHIGLLEVIRGGPTANAMKLEELVEATGVVAKLVALDVSFAVIPIGRPLAPLVTPEGGKPLDGTCVEFATGGAKTADVASHRSWVLRMRDHDHHVFPASFVTVSDPERRDTGWAVVATACAKETFDMANGVDVAVIPQDPQGWPVVLSWRP